MFLLLSKKCKEESSMDAMRIGNETNYWLVRPGVSGKCYEDFYKDSCVAIGWDRIGKIDENGHLASLEELKYLVKNKYQDLLSKKTSTREYKRKISDIATKIYRFTYEVKVGDIIITPGDTSVLIGRVVGDVQIVNGKYTSYSNDKEEEYIGELNKARKVVWLKRIEKVKLEPNIKLELRVVHGLSQISNEQVITEINRSIYSFYTYNNVGHSIYKINTEKSIDFERYAKFISCVYDIYSKIKTEEENLYIKANINSPGPIELFGNIQVVEKITSIMNIIFKSQSDDEVLSECDARMIEELKQKHGGENYDDYEFPSGGQV